jgi:ribose 5-phosphate isomerase B
MTKIAIGSDHAGFRLKKLIITHFTSVDFDDIGTHTEDSCDYPDYAAQTARMVADGKADLGIAICGTGIGASIAANKVRGIRAALCLNEFMAAKSREHNNANVLVLGARVTGDDLSLSIVEKWLNTPFEGGGRHQRRIDKISAIETIEDDRTK